MKYTIVYKYRDGHHNKHVAPAVLNEQIETLKRRYGKTFKPEHLVDASRSKKSTTHAAFEWDDTIAGEAYRVTQAQRLISSLCTIKKSDEDEEVGRIEPTYVSTSRPFQLSDGYMSAQDAMADPVVRQSVLDTAQMSLDAWVKRHRYLHEIAKEVDEAAAIAERLKGRQAKARKTKKKARRPDLQPA